MKVKLLPCFDLPLDLELFLNHEVYCLDNIIYMQIMVGALAIYETIKVPVIKYQAENPKTR